jgi:hypothetical protein
MSEDDLLRTVLDMARLFGLRTAHFRPAQSKSGNWITAVAGDGKGYPDLTIVGHGGVMFRELKSDRGTLSPDQRVWLVALEQARADVGVWRPVDLRSGRIERELRALRSANPSATSSRKIQFPRDVAPIPQV